MTIKNNKQITPLILQETGKSIKITKIVESFVCKR